MRKAAVLLAVVLAVCIGAVAILGSAIHKACDRVTLTEHTVSGDPQAAKGLKICYKTGYDNRLIWETEFTPKGEAETAYSFSADPRYPTPYYERSGLNINSAAHDLYLTEEGHFSFGLGEAAEELYQSLKPGEEGTVTVRVADYLEYYPISVTLDLEDGMHGANSYEIMAQLEEGGIADPYTAAMVPIFEYFKIPVLPEETCMVSVGVNANGTVGSLGSGSAEGDAYYIYTYNTATEDAVYFTIHTHSVEGQVVDTSLLPDGYGLFRIPLDPMHVDEDGDSDGPLVAEKMEMVYPLDPADEVLYLHTDAEQRQLLLWIREEDMLCLHVIDIETMEQLQHLKIAPWEQGKGSGAFFDREGYVAILLWHSEEMAVVSRHADGSWALDWICPMDAEQTRLMSRHRSALAYDGEKLAVCDTGWNYDYSIENGADLCLAVYDASGLLYYGVQESSLSTGMDEQNWDYHVAEYGSVPIQLEWMS
ncbi:MAG: hypothetical protein IJP11_03940 [Oscillospiraceae bacterium]|nr:hypothetical protein [Oscillospiraceae bacterium]